MALAVIGWGVNKVCRRANEKKAKKTRFLASPGFEPSAPAPIYLSVCPFRRCRRPSSWAHRLRVQRTAGSLRRDTKHWNEVVGRSWGLWDFPCTGAFVRTMAGRKKKTAWLALVWLGPWCWRLGWLGLAWVGPWCLFVPALAVWLALDLASVVVGWAVMFVCPCSGRLVGARLGLGWLGFFCSCFQNL